MSTLSDSFLLPAFQREADRESNARSRWESTVQKANELAADRTFQSSMEFLEELSRGAQVSFTTAQRVYADMKGRLNTATGRVNFDRR